MTINASTSTSAVKQAPQVELLPPSITMRVGKRRLTLSWRPRKRLPVLLSGLLLRSWRNLLAPALRVSVTAAAVCGAWQTQALAAAPAPGTLPAGWSVVNGNVTFTQNGNTLNISQLSPQAIANFASFSIGSNAVVDISQPSSAAAFLAKVTGGDISQIYGKLTAPGTVALYNPNGILIGPGGMVDVGRFIATTLAINDNDFLAGKLTFAKQGGAGTVENQGTIKSATGGSVYLIGSSVTNGGIITSPQGEVILAAGETVTLADTATPGVTVNVTGAAGSVTNLGSITAEAGRIGVAAGLITNSGIINASSVVREGGRIFLRASSNLTTTASSNISADGIVGGNVTLYSSGSAFIDGDVSATGAPGKGGFVETSGLTRLDVVKVPTVGSGGTWLIDPYDLEVVAGSTFISSDASGGSCGTAYAVTSEGNSAKIGATLISNQLNQSVNVNLNTTGIGGSQGGNITVSSAITKGSGGEATLALNADGNISINADITSTSGPLHLNLSTGYRDDSGSGAVRVSSVNSGARVMLNGGNIRVSDGSEGYGNGALQIVNGSVSLDNCGTLSAGALTIGSAGKLNLGDNAQVNVSSVDNSGTVNVTGYTTVNVTGSATNNGTINISAAGSIITDSGFTNAAGGKVLLTGEGTTFNTSGNGQWVNNGTINVTGVGQTLSMRNKGGLINNGNLTVSNATVSVGGEVPGMLSNDGTVTLNNGTVSFYSVVNNGTISGSGTVGGTSSVQNNGTLAPGGDGGVGSMRINGNFSQTATGIIKLDLASAESFDRITFGGAVVTLGGTLQTTLLGNYRPVEDSFIPFSFDHGTTVIGSTYFRNVTGTVLTIDGAKQMMKATYSESGVRLSLQGSETFYATGTNSDWGSKQTWKDADGMEVSTYVPSQIDTVVINSSVSVQHSDGNDTIDKLVINGGGTLNLTGGNLTVSSSTTTANNSTLNVSSSNGASALTLSGENQLAGNMSITGSEGRAPTVTLNGSSNISGNVSILAGTLALNGNTTGSGNLTIGSIANNLNDFNGFNGEMEVSPATPNVSIANALSNLHVNLQTGNLTLTGGVRFDSLSVSNGSVTGASGSRLNVAESFTQTGGNMTLADAALSQASGALTVGNITANNLVLESQGSNIAQASGTSLHVKKQLIASSVSGTTLTNSGNQIAGFAANNSGTGNISLTNTLNTTDASVVSLNGINNNNGNIVIDNTGGMATTAIGSGADFLGSLPTNANGTTVSTSSKLSVLGINGTGQVKTTNGTVSLVTHSPLTIGSGGVSASGTITLQAGSTTGSNSVLTLNGTLVSLGGNITLSAGDSMTINANISTSPPGVALLSVVSGQVIGYAQGVTITDANGVKTPVPATNSSGTSQAVLAASQQQSQQTQSLQSTIDSAQVSAGTQSSTNGLVQTSSGDGHSTGGTSGSFGDEGDGKKAVTKKLNMCT
ncbi:beta strand repeat-containing protein [Herbaspirillum robiniae]|uniref:Filamentous hemagglutinin N-terminal domain-containing protein n=1 Tax=Herbaspirillum robiniae TaxID=2014887 RepID=A0ABX2LXU3_9BURK|nr:filamentous hemagglutinin N-terminal domain-containing protein [Herbaspirillum robiniae]NUU03307.1 filamentous hemagglutinin N-terminal domain-containing protein [Herbaspirillum robiniae]